MLVATPDQFQGCMLGLALGDALGAPYEGGVVERLLWRMIGKTERGEMRWTDDTLMSIDVAESLIAQGGVDADDLARRFALSYRWSRGYGPGTARLLKRIAGGDDWQTASRVVYPDGSFGNGGAMRSPIVALFHASSPATLASHAADVARVTHAHPLGVEGAVLVAWATVQALNGTSPFEGCIDLARQASMQQRLDTARRWLQSGATPDSREVARQLGNGVAASDSCVTAIYLATRFLAEPFDEMLAFIARCGGDVDTLGAMAGAIWGAARGMSGLPAAALAKLEQRERLSALAVTLHLKARGGVVPGA